MIVINIISAAGNITTISAGENSTIKDFKKEYVKTRKEAGLDLDEFNFQFRANGRILYNDQELNKLSEAELNITSLEYNQIRAGCLREIKNLDSSSNNTREELDHLLAILTTNISEEEGISILASSDSEIILAAVKCHGEALQYAPEILKNNRIIVLAAVQQKVLALRYASKELKADYAFMLAAVQKNRLALVNASRELKNDSYFMLAALQQDGWVIQYASPKLKNDKEFMLAAVQQNGWALAFASPDLKNDRNIVLAAVQQKVLALQYASPELKNDGEILKKIKKIRLEALIRPLNEMERGQPSTSSSSSSCSSSQAYPTPKIRSPIKKTRSQHLII